MEYPGGHKKVPTMGKSPYEGIGMISFIFLRWINPLIHLGYQRPLEAEDIPPLPMEFRADEVLEQFEAEWKREREKRGDQASAARAIVRAYRKEILMSTLCFFPYAAIVLVQPYFVNDLLTHLSGHGHRYFPLLENGYALAFIFGFLSIINAIFTSLSFTLISLSGLKMKVAVIAAVFRKSIRLSSSSKSKHSTGEKVTMISADAERVWYGILFINWIWGGPAMIIASMVLLIINVGVASVVALVVMCLLFATQAYVGKTVGAVRARQTKFTDERTKLINESLQGIRIIKYYAWEDATARRIEYLRAQEVAELTKYQLLKMINVFIMFIGPSIAAYALFMVYLRMGGDLTVSKVYTIYALLNVVRMPFSVTPMAFASWQEAKVALQRLTTFLLLPEYGDDKLLTDQSHDAANVENPSPSSEQDSQKLTLETTSSRSLVPSPGRRVLFQLDNSTFSWDGSEDSFRLQDINLQIRSSDFIAVVGGVGSGKTSLVSALLGQMILKRGEMYPFPGRDPPLRVAYVAQEHWICNASLQQGILFNSDYHPEHYIETLEHCQLTADLLVLPHADYTSIGERGLNLSGGQKARVSIARAYYAGYQHRLVGMGTEDDAEEAEENDKAALAAEATENQDGGAGTSPSAETRKKRARRSATPADIDIYIFDDVLASVDVHVGKALFQQAMCSPHIADKARLVCLSSNYHLLPHFHKVVVMEHGRVVCIGDWKEVCARYPEYNIGGKASVLERTASTAQVQLEEQKEKDQGEARAISESPSEELVQAEASPLPSPSLRSESSRKPMLFEANREMIEEKRKEATDLLSMEDREKGAVAFATYLSYFSFALGFLQFFRRHQEIHHQKSGAAHSSQAPSSSPSATTRKQPAGRGGGKSSAAASTMTPQDARRFLDDFGIDSKYEIRGNQMMYPIPPATPNRAISTTSLAADVPQDPKYAAIRRKNQLVGFSVALVVFVLFAFSQATRVLTDLWMGYWAEDEQSESSRYSDEFYSTYFTVLTWGTVFVTLVRSVLFVFICLGSSYKLHNMILVHVMQAPVNLYFDLTPVGRILNRFTKDLDNLDTYLPDVFLQTLTNGFYLLSIFIVCLISSPFFVVLLFPVIVLFYILQSSYRRSSREMRRLESLSRSPLYSLFGEILQGLSTIQSFHYQDLFQTRFFESINRHISQSFVFWFSSRWLALRLDILSTFVAFFLALLSVILKGTNSSPNSNLMGIALVYSLQLTALLQWTVRLSIDTETHMTSVERLQVFQRIDAEKMILQSHSEGGGAAGGEGEVIRKAGKTARKDVKESYALVPAASVPSSDSEHALELQSMEEGGEQGPSSAASHHPSFTSSLRSTIAYYRSCPLPLLRHWPTTGRVELRNVFLQYRPGLPFVLQGLNLDIPGGCKVGIVGRTAAGKSSLMLALFRMVEVPPSSSICIDGVDIKSIPLPILRSRLTIIPQDPFMFSGTLRENLDPFGQYSEEEILEALDRVHLLEDVKLKFPQQLEHPISERGENISVGQRQLVCIARALLRKSKVIVMDEATASVDSATDAKIQRTIREAFKDCTVLTIAHRLETIADYDMIVVMANGKVVEAGAPMDLLTDDLTQDGEVGEAVVVAAASQQEGKEGEQGSASGKSRIFQGFIDELGPERRAAFMDIVRSRHSQAQAGNAN